MSILDVKERNELRLLGIPGVGAVGADLEKNEIIVYVEDESVCARVPSVIEGVRVRCMVVGRIELE